MHSEVQFAAVAFKFIEEEKQQKTLPVPPVGLNIAIAPGQSLTCMSTCSICHWRDMGVNLLSAAMVNICFISITTFGLELLLSILAMVF